MAPESSRWRDIVLNPCNHSAERRNWAATKDALQALAEQPAATPEVVAGSDLKFFQVTADAIGSDSCSVVEVAWNSGSSLWEPTGTTYTAYDWSPNGVFKQNFVEDFYGVGRVNEEVAADALEVLAIEGYARFIEGTATGSMSSQQVTVTINEYWGDPLNGRSPGASVTVKDPTNNAPQLANGDKVLAVFDEKNQEYVLIAPWKGSQTPGTSALVQVKSGTINCDESLEKNNLCIYPGIKVDISAQALIDEAFCDEQFQDGQAVWIIDARGCRKVDRLIHGERYIAVQMVAEFDSGSGPKPLYAVVDASPPIRWFRVLSNAEAIVEDGEQNNLRCRDCDDDDVLDDSPSVWGVWHDVNPCEFDDATVPDNTAKLIYFPMHRLRCSTLEEQIAGGFDECLDTDVDPFCRNNELVLAWWNPLSQRWEAITDLEKCINLNGQETAHIVVCNPEPNETCCVWDAVKLKYSPRNSSYCLPKVEREKVWVRCSNGFIGNLPIGYCKLGVKICNNFNCQGENREAFMFDCGDCTECTCPDQCEVVTFRMYTDNPNDDCGSIIGDIVGSMLCVDQNPMVEYPGPPITIGERLSRRGFWGEFEVIGIEPRILYSTTGNYGALTNQIILIEVACGGTGHAPGTIISKWKENGDPINQTVTFTAGIEGCLPSLDSNGFQQYRVRTYRYGLWVQCFNNKMANVQIYWLKNTEMIVGGDTQTIDPDCSSDCNPDPEPRIVATQEAMWGDGGFEEVSQCCVNTQVVDRVGIGGTAIECQQNLDSVPIIGMPQNLEFGKTTCPSCFHGKHIFAGCPCSTFGDPPPGPGTPGWPGASGWMCDQNYQGCVSTNWYIQLEWVPGAGSGPPL